MNQDQLIQLHTARQSANEELTLLSFALSCSRSALESRRNELMTSGTCWSWTEISVCVWREEQESGC